MPPAEVECRARRHVRRDRRRGAKIAQDAWEPPADGLGGTCLTPCRWPAGSERVGKLPDTSTTAIATTEGERDAQAHAGHGRRGARGLRAGPRLHGDERVLR